jgi:hypothetical protein
MKDHDPIGADAREATHLRRLGPPPHVCAFCGFPDPFRLTATLLAWVEARVPSKFLQDHHVVGRQHDDTLIVLLCLNCHGLVHRRYLDAGVDLRPEPDPIKQVALMLRARAAFANLEAERLCEWADLLDNARNEDADEREGH